MKQIFLKSLFLTTAVLLAYATAGQSDTTIRKKEDIKTGFTWFPLPVVAYDADLGFQYGLIGSIQLFGDGSSYPEYRHQFLAEVSRFTKGSGVNQFFYDSRYLLPKKIRITVDISYLTEKALDFYGFNGYEAAFHPELMDDESDEYISRVFYRYERKLFRVVTDFQGEILGNRLRWLGGFSFFNIKIATVDIERINKGKSEDKQLPDTTILYDNYTAWGLIPAEEKEGGQLNFFKLGMIYDTRDNESNASKGIWEEIILFTAPKFFFNKDFAFTKLVLTHRQYIPLVSKKLTFAYRLSYQGTIGGHAPFFYQPYLISSFSTDTKPDGLGGAKSIRGVMRNRIVGDDVAYGNIELRWKFFKTVLWNYNLYLALHGFCDAGMIVQPVSIDKNKVPEGEDLSRYFDASDDSMHWSYGAGLRIAINENFIVAVDYGFAFDRRDGKSGLYIGINNLF